MISVSTIVGSPTIGAPSLVSMRPAAMRKAKLRHKQNRDSAKQRGIPFMLDLPTWLKIWAGSGHWHQRGKRHGQYCLSRFKDRGSYVEGNIEIKLTSANTSERQLGRDTPAKHRASLSAALMGNQNSRGHKLRHTAAARAKMSASHLAMWAKRRAEGAP